MTPEKLLPTANGSGVAIFDFDADGKLDLYFATGNDLPLSAAPAAGTGDTGRFPSAAALQVPCCSRTNVNTYALRTRPAE